MRKSLLPVGVVLAVLISGCGGSTGPVDEIGKGDWDPTTAGTRPVPAAAALQVLSGYQQAPTAKWQLDTTAILGSRNDNQMTPILDLGLAGQPGTLIAGVSQVIKDAKRRHVLAGIEAESGKVLWQTAVGEFNGWLTCGVLTKAAKVACLHEGDGGYEVDLFSFAGTNEKKVKLAPRSTSFGKPGFAVREQGFAISENTNETPAQLIYYDASGAAKWHKETVSMGINPGFNEQAVFGPDYSFNWVDGSVAQPAFLSDKYQPLITSVSRTEVALAGGPKIEIPAGHKIAVPGPIDALVPAVLLMSNEQVTAYSPDGKKQWTLAGVSGAGFAYCGGKIYLPSNDPQKKLVAVELKTGNRLATAALSFDAEQFFCTDSSVIVLNNKQARAITAVDGGSLSELWAKPVKFGFGDQLFAVSNGLIHADNRSKGVPVVQLLS